jgi:hypothetical protein
LTSGLVVFKILGLVFLNVVGTQPKALGYFFSESLVWRKRFLQLKGCLSGPPNFRTKGNKMNQLKPQVLSLVKLLSAKPVGFVAVINREHIPSRQATCPLGRLCIRILLKSRLFRRRHQAGLAG